MSVRIDYWNELAPGGTMTDEQRLKVEVVSLQRTVESLVRQLHDERLRHGDEMRRLERRLREAKG